MPPQYQFTQPITMSAPPDAPWRRHQAETMRVLLRRTNPKAWSDFMQRASERLSEMELLSLLCVLEKMGMKVEDARLQRRREPLRRMSHRARRRTGDSAGVATSTSICACAVERLGIEDEARGSIWWKRSKCFKGLHTSDVDVVDYLTENALTCEVMRCFDEEELSE
ncbi:hypothetical protein NM688_g558 [Phlebia brevispora]|uniref:Uncharacterized protein n=1 Tax=Phlebia brevispora TaxID=194682 RepID=A0ACC1TEA1_9APHY|nr:hypothetical protein NM688_g558 [Phlebia brevispora]